ncbi:MAG: phosphatidylinositol mannoside acyltransferase [Motilibacteraceae bacterium]
MGGLRLDAAARDRLTVLVWTAAWRLVRLLPERLAYALFRLGADVAWRRRGRGVVQLERNLARAEPGAGPERLRELSRAGMRSYLQYWCDAFRLPDWSYDRSVRTVAVVDEWRVREPLAAGRGVVCVLPHMGNWDHVGAWATRTGMPLTTVAERLKPEEVYERFVGYREGLGMRILPLTGGDVDVLGALVEHAAGGGLVCLLGDRDLHRTGVPVQLLGEPTRFPPGPALVALRTGAALLPVTTHNEGRRLVVRLHPYVGPPATGTLAQKVRAMTQQVADVFGAAIAEHPEAWHMLQPVWPADLDDARRAALDGPGGERVAS